MRTTLVVLLMAGLCLADADVAFVCDGDGTDSNSNFTVAAPAICDAMSESFTYEVVTDNGDTGIYTGDTAWWDDYDIVIWYASGVDDSGRETTAAEQTAADAFLNSGGWLMVTGYDVLGDPDDPIMADIVRSSSYGDDSSDDEECEITDTSHFITNGPYGSFSGTYTLYEDDHDDYEPDTSAGCVEVIAMINGAGYSKLIDCVVGSGHVTGWNGNDYSYDWEDDEDWANMLRNWISEALANTSNIEETTWGQIKAL